jgi:hypothetical protein
MKGYKLVSQSLQSKNGIQWVKGVLQTCQFGEPHKVFKNGFHFSQVPCFAIFHAPSHLSFVSPASFERPLQLLNNMPKPELNFKYVEVEASGQILTDGDISSSKELTIVREIPDDEWKQLCTGTFTNSNGTQYHMKQGLFHNEKGPAIQNAFGHKMWFKDGLEIKP